MSGIIIIIIILLLLYVSCLMFNEIPVQFGTIQPYFPPYK